MTISPVERKARAALPILRFMQTVMPLPAAQWLLTQSVARLRLEDDLRRESVSADGVPCEWVIPHKSSPNQALLYLHGGGFVFGLTPPHLQMAAYLARKLAMPILMVDYRLAPGYPFPAALEDCVTAYRWLLNQGFSAQNLALAGDSAGGNLTITALMNLRDSGDPLPAAAACLSPVTDLTKNHAHPERKDPLLPARAMRFYSQSYVGDSDARLPSISPVFGNLAGLPPLLIHVGEDEILRDDAVRLHGLAQAAGVEAQLAIYPRMWHVWQLNLDLPQAIQSLEDIARFFSSHIGVGL